MISLKMKVRIGLFFGFSALFANIALGGGESVPAKILNLDVYSRSQAVAKIQLIKGQNIYFFKNCRTITLYLDDKPEWFWERTWSKIAATTVTYQKSILLLTQAYKSERVINIGAMGSGFKPVKSEECAFQSRGLAVEGGDVYSFYNPV